jgi:hypothetical protein
MSVLEFRRNQVSVNESEILIRKFSLLLRKLLLVEESGLIDWNPTFPFLC